jgi:hypothetical protein
MEIVAHSLWAAAAAIAANRSMKVRLHVGRAVCWAAFPDALAFGPPLIAGLWLRLVNGPGPVAADGHFLPHVHVGLPLYQAGHSLLVFLVTFGICSALMRRPLFEMFGWLMHILIDIPTHSFSYYATRFLWPVSEFRIDGIAWWTPWFWAATYVGLLMVYVAMWRQGWLTLPTAGPRPGR